jgi:transposase
MSIFATERHLSSWAKVCPGNRRSAGLAKPEHVGRGNPWLRSSLIEAAWSASRSQDTFLAAQYHRLARRLGAKRAAMAVAHTILVIVYHLIRDEKSYQELGATFHDQRSRKIITRRLTKRLEDLGFQVTLQAKEAA